MKHACHCYKRARITLIFIASFGALQCLPNDLNAQAAPAAQQSPATTDSAMPTAETNSSSTTPADDASVGTACDLPKNSGDGFVIISATMPPKERRLGSPLSFSYEYKAKDSGWLKSKKDIAINYRNGFHKATSDFNGVLGKLYLLRLRAGAYEFQGWEYMRFGFNGTWRPDDIHPLTFTVEPGRAVYLGGFDPRLIEGKNFLHQKVAEAWVLVNDDQTRDLPVFFNKCPGFDRNLLDVKVMDTSPWLPPKKK